MVLSLVCFLKEREIHIIGKIFELWVTKISIWQRNTYVNLKSFQNKLMKQKTKTFTFYEYLKSISKKKNPGVHRQKNPTTYVLSLNTSRHDNSIVLYHYGT